MLKGKKHIKSNLIYMIPMLIAMALVNPLFNHEGITVIGYLPSGNPLTAESVIYGMCASFMITSVICHFSCYNEVMTSDKFMYLFGKIIPSLSLILSMTLRFVPLFSERLKKTVEVQKCIGKGLDEKGVFRKIKNALRILSITVTWALENAIDTADSMKARGYGTGKRTSFSNYRLEKRDIAVLLYLLLLGIYVIVGNISGQTDFSFFPVIKSTPITVYSISIFLCYFLLCVTPVIIELWEVRRWKYLRSKI
jgi:energy-coupling factor transport system permease protein